MRKVSFFILVMLLVSTKVYAKKTKKKHKKSTTIVKQTDVIQKNEPVNSEKLSNEKVQSKPKNQELTKQVKAEVKTVAQQETKKQPEKPKRKILDKIDAIVHGPVRSQVFCKSDQQRRGIDGRQRNLEDNISEELGYQKVKEMNAPMDDSMVKEHLNRTVQGFGLKPGDEEKIFAQEGYSYSEGFDKFRLMFANNMLIEHFIKQKIMVCEDEVIEFYNKNPIEKEEKYQLKTAFIPVDRQKGQKARGIEMDIDRFIKTGTGVDVTWSEPYWVLQTDIAEHTTFIPEMKIDEMQKQKVIGGFQLYQMVKKKPKRLVSLKKRYREIADNLRQPKFETMYKKHQKSLFDGATIVHL